MSNIQVDLLHRPVTPQIPYTRLRPLNGRWNPTLENNMTLFWKYSFAKKFFDNRELWRIIEFSVSANGTSLIDIHAPIARLLISHLTFFFGIG